MLRNKHPRVTVSLVVVVLFVAVAASQPAAAQFVVQPIAVAGDDAPDRPGAMFDSFNGVSLNNAGEAAIVAQTAFNDGGIWSSVGGALALEIDSSFNESIELRDNGTILRVHPMRVDVITGGVAATIVEVGQSVPGLEPAAFDRIIDFQRGPSGRSLLNARIVNPDTSRADGLWILDNLGFHLVALEGDPVPEVGPNYVLHPYYGWRELFPTIGTFLAGNRNVAFVGAFEEPPFGYTLNRGFGIFISQNGTTELVYRNNDPVPGFAGAYFQGFKHPRIEPNGDLVFNAIVNGPGINETNRQYWFRQTATELQVLVGTGRIVPGESPERFTSIRDVAFGANGVAFLAAANATDDAALSVQRVMEGPFADLETIRVADWLADPPAAEGEVGMVISLTGNADGRLVLRTTEVAGDEIVEQLRMRGHGLDRVVLTVGDTIDGAVVDAIADFDFNDRAEIAAHLRFDDGTDGVYLFQMLGDYDHDGDIDLGDFSSFSLCFAGAGLPPAGSCPPGVDADFDGDGDVDLGDFSAFSLSYTGAI